MKHFANAENFQKEIYFDAFECSMLFDFVFHEYVFSDFLGTLVNQQ